MLIALPAVSDWLQATRAEVWVRRYRLMPSVEIRVPERLYLAATAPAPRKAPPRSRSLRRMARRKPSAGSAEPALRTSAGRRRRFELPRLRPRQTDQTLLQPDFPAELPVLGRISLPDLLIWSPLPNQPAFRIRKPFVSPGSAEPFAQPPAFDAPPQLTAPNWEALTSELQVAAAPASSPESLLLPAISLPIRLPELITRPPHTFISTERSVGDPLSVLALNWRLRPVREGLIIPAGNQLAEVELAATLGANRTAEAAGGADQGPQPQPDAPKAQQGQSSPGQASATDTGSVPAQPTQAGDSGATAGAAASATHKDSARQTEAPAGPSATARQQATEPTGQPAASAKVAQAANPLAEASRSATPPAPPPPERAVMRIEHPPGGVADVVVVQPAPMDGTIETGGALSGRPVYSVFLHVGAPRQWILQYCVPGEDQSTVVVDGVVRLGRPAPLVAPYPKVTYLPPLRSRPGTYLLIHGYLSATGRLEGLAPLRAADRDEAAAIVPVLERWEFRPAMRDGQPVRIEVLLAIPRG